MIEIEWQPISTAPEDTWILLGSPNIVTWGMVRDGRCYQPDLRYAEILGITHWMPLPEPPSKPCEQHAYGSSEYENSNCEKYVCSKCGYELRCSQH